MKKLAITLFIVIGSWLTASAQDWAAIGLYRGENAKRRDSVTRVIYFGDSITAGWIYEDSVYFHSNHYADRGIGGQTSPQMLLRFRQDVIALHPKAVVILCGTNDIAGNTGPMTAEMTEDNIMSMTELAKANHIKVILCSILPAISFPWKPELQPADSIIAINKWIKPYAAKNHLGYINYYDALVNDQKGMKAEYSPDGVHPNKDGYKVMEQVAEPVIKKIIGK